MTDRDTTTRTRARAPGVGGVFHRMAVHDRVLRPDSERSTAATTRCTKGGCKLDGGRRMPGAGLSRRSPRKAPFGKPAFQPYWGKLTVRNDRGDRGNVGIIRSPIRASILPDQMIRQPGANANPYVPIIMLTGHSEKKRVIAARDAGVTEFLAKPISAKALYQRILNVVANPRPFIKTRTYFGPDRRRNVNPNYSGPDRR